MKAIIMAGGEGSRLRPLTCDCPKPMLRLMGRPLMEYAVRLLKKHGITQIGATLGYLPDAIMDHFGDGEEFGVEMRYYIEKTPLGTAGSVKQAQDFLDEPFVVLSGDGITDFDLQAAIDFHRKNDAHATLLLKKCANPQEYGMVVTDEQHRIKSFHEKPGRCDVFSDRINTGIYILEPELLRRIPADRPYDFGHEFFPTLLEEGTAIYGYTAEGYWCDVGDVPAYLRVHMDAMEGKIHLDGLEGGVRSEGAILEEGCRLDAPCFIGKGSRIAAGAHIGPYTVIGENCRVEGFSGVKRSILLDGAQVDTGAQLRGCILGTNAHVRENALLYEDSVVGSGSCIGARAILPPGLKLWPNKSLPDGRRPDGNIVWGEQREQRFTGGSMEMENPIQAARAAQSCASALKPREILLGRGVSTVSDALWHAVAAGIMAQGVQVINAGISSLPQLRHAQQTLCADAAMLVEDRSLTPLVKSGAFIPEKTQRAILKLYERQDFAAPFSTLTRPMAQAGQTDMVYISHAASAFRAEPHLAPEIALFVPSEHLRELAVQSFERAGLKVRCEWDARSMQLLPGETGIYLSDDGQHAVFADSDGRLDEVQSQLLLAWTALELGEPMLILHNSATRAIEALTAKYKAYARYLPGEYALWMNTLAEKTPLQFRLQFDGIYSSLAALSMLTQKRLSLAQWRKNMPGVCRKSCSIPVAASESGRLLHIVAERAKNVELGGGVRLIEEDSWAWLSPDDRRPELHITAEAMTMEAAAGMCDFLEGELHSLLRG